jgi:PAS domain S-box-containing protein
VQDITERKRAEQELKKFQYTIDQSSETVFWIKRDGGFEYVNDEACRSLGHSRDELLGMKIFDIDPVLTREHWNSDMERFYTGKKGGSITFESVHRRKDGATFPVEVRAQVLWFGEQDLHVSVARNITQRKKGEYLLRESEENFRTLVDNMHDAVYRCDLDGTIVFTTPSSARILGCSSVEEMIGSKILDFYYNPKEAVKQYKKLKKEGKLAHYEATLKRKDTGEPVYVMVNSQFYRDRDGNIIGIEGVYIDITERKRTEETLQQEKIFTNAVLDSIPGLLYMYDEEGRLRRWNKNHETFTGYTAKELYGMHVLDWFKHDPKDEAAIQAGVEKAFTEGHASAEGSLMTKSGKRIPYYFTATLLEIQGKKYFTGIGIDISERRQTEEALGNAVREKEALLQELQHRMKNSLAIITGIIELEAVRTKNAGEKTVLNNLRGRIDSLTNLYTLLFQTNTVTEVALDDYIHSIVSSLTASYMDSMNTIRIERQCDPLTVSVKNATAWGLIANELLTNALKYAFPGDGTGLIRILLKTSDGEASLSVSDNGAGPPPDFDIDRPAGFGLLLVNMLTKQLGGVLSFTRGAENVFTIRAPAHT